MTSEQFIEKYRVYSLFKSNEVFLPPVRAFEFIEESFKHGFAILGIDGIKIIDGKKHAPMEMIADFSSAIRTSETWDVYREVCQRAAKEFLNLYAKEPSVSFTFVLLSKEKFLNCKNKNRQ